MSLLVRGIVWFGVYVALVLLPLALAAWVDPIAAPRRARVEVAAAFGFVGFATILIQFALVSRLHAASRPFGADALLQFHRQMGLVSLSLVIAHPLLLRTPAAAWTPFSGATVTRTGAIALWAMILLAVTSLLRRRLKLSYEGWQLIHLGAALVGGGAMIAHVFAAGVYAAHPAMQGILAAYAFAFIALTARYRLVRPLLMWRRPWEVVANRDEGASTHTIRVVPVGHAGFSFDPGQFAWLLTGATPLWSQQHPISISSSTERPPDGAIEFSVKALGDWSSGVVPALAPGRRLWVDGPFGAFTPDRVPGQGLVLIAGGIGVAPMRAILLSMRDRDDRRHVMLFQAAHDESRLLFEHELDSLREAVSLDIVRVLEAPASSWRDERGLITRELLVRRLPAQYLRYQFFVCGPAPMMDAMEEVLLSLRVPAASIQTERFDMV